MFSYHFSNHIPERTAIDQSFLKKRKFVKWPITPNISSFQVEPLIIEIISSLFFFPFSEET